MTPSADNGPIPAATLVLLRDCEVGPPELLMVERALAMRFAGGALVFPGGRIDAGDYRHAMALHPQAPGNAAIAAAAIAAIRETLEEAGLPVGLSPMPHKVQLAAIRAGLHAGEDFATLLAHHHLALDTGSLTLFAHWCPNHPNMRIFDTLFFVAQAPAFAPEPIVDATENTRVFWQSAHKTLDDAAAGRAAIIFPTKRNLERLAQFSSYADAAAHAARHPICKITPWIEERSGEPHLCIPEGLGYPITAEPMSRTRRG